MSPSSPQPRSVDVGESWSHSELRFDIDNANLHKLTLRWPRLPPVGDTPFDAIARRLERGLEAELHPVFGEVYSLHARSVTKPRRKNAPESFGPS